MHDFNEAAWRPIIEAARKGLPQRLIADKCGIQRSVLNDWLSKGDDGQEPFARFSTAYRQAAAEWGETEWEAAGGEAKFATGPQWRLEKRYPEDFGNRTKLEVEHSGTVNVAVINFRDVPIEEVMALASGRPKREIVDVTAEVVPTERVALPLPTGATEDK